MSLWPFIEAGPDTIVDGAANLDPKFEFRPVSTSVCVARKCEASIILRVGDAPYGKTIPDDGGNDFRRLRDIDRANGDELEEDDEELGEATLFMEEWDAVSLSIPSSTTPLPNISRCSEAAIRGGETKMFSPDRRRLGERDLTILLWLTSTLFPSLKANVP